MALPETKIEYIKEFLRQRAIPIKNYARPILIAYEARKYGQDIKVTEKLDQTLKINTAFWLYREPFLLMSAMIESGALTDANIADYERGIRYFGFTALTPMGYNTKATFHENLVLDTKDPLFWTYINSITSKAKPEVLTTEEEIKAMTTGKTFWDKLLG